MNAPRQRSGLVAAIDVTPMADVMIVLLILFMVATPLFTRPVSLPPAANASSKGKEDLVVVLDSEGVLRLEGEALLGREELLPRLGVRLEALPPSSRVVVLKADERLPYHEVGAVLDLCRQAGASQVELLTRVHHGL